MFGLFKTPSFSDPKLGDLQRLRGLWRGSITLCGESAPLALSGSRREPDAHALEIACELATSYARWRRQIADSMLQHYSPYAEAVACGEAAPPEDGMPELMSADDVWRYAEIDFIQVTPLGGELTVEIGYRVSWDEEHLLGARLRQGRLIELNGSVVPP